ncbi:hypothetical protein DQ04_02251040 [Trypanosoma grayi]|uniref:hypothetical protein n=1 Tax=Trypanosoma grayi TaxID=71804 RepID=UPI0004F4118F|nr:hypothetical protein DQ04_02251040 [Trypanosoma grayi]KEG11814.1 hypothetical protein DQ04_02251040 [Trypanosoma grayi]
MGDNSAASSAAQLVATIRHENLQLEKRVAEVRHENLILKRQLYNLSALLDIAVSKLASKGITLETPIGIRELRTAISSREIIDTPADAIDANDLTYGNAAAQGSFNRRFQFPRELREHTKPVQCAAFAPGDQPILATGGLDCRLILHNFLTGEKMYDNKGHEQNVSDVAWFEGSGNILSASFDGTVKVWDPRHTSSTATPVYQFNANGFVLAAVPLDKAFVFACTDSKRRTSIVDLRVQKPISWRHDVRANTLTFNSAMAQLVTGHNNGTIAVWDVRKVGLALSSTTPLEGETLSSSAPAASLTSAPVDESPAVPVPLISVIENEPSQSAITYISHYHHRDDSRRLVVVSVDNMVRLYRATGLNTSSNDAFTLRNVVGGVPTRGYTARAAFWRGAKEKTNVSAFFDDGERETDQQPRRLTECDLMVTCGAENTACIYDVTEEGTAVLVEKLEGHRDRVVGAAIHHADSKPIIATYSADNTVKIWVPIKN